VTPRRNAFAIVASGLLLSACGSAGDSSAHQTQTPTQVALAWFGAINSHNVGVAKELFEPSQQDQISWMDQPATDQSTFSDIHCKPMKGSDVRANVLCTFVESASPTEGNPDTFWTISFVRGTNHEWLISSYGQG
jgi:hypothetical protein